MKKPENIAEQLDNDPWAMRFFDLRWAELQDHGSMTQEYLFLFACKEALRFDKNPLKVIQMLSPYTKPLDIEKIISLQQAQWPELVE